MSRKKTKKIVFVCTGNTCRSPMAEILLKSKLEQLGVKSVQAYSAGVKAVVGDTINPLAKQTLEENGLSAGEFSSTLLTDKILTEAFALVCMTEKQRELLMDMRWNALRKKGVEEIENNVYSFADITGYEVFDPVGTDADCYRYVCGLLDAGMSALIEKFELRKEVVAPAKKRGRPKKTDKAETPTLTAPKKRGRPKKIQPKEGEKI